MTVFLTLHCGLSTVEILHDVHQKRNTTPQTPHLVCHERKNTEEKSHQTSPIRYRPSTEEMLHQTFPTRFSKQSWHRGDITSDISYHVFRRRCTSDPTKDVPYQRTTIHTTHQRHCKRDTTGEMPRERCHETGITLGMPQKSLHIRDITTEESHCRISREKPQESFHNRYTTSEATPERCHKRDTTREASQETHRKRDTTSETVQKRCHKEVATIWIRTSDAHHIFRDRGTARAIRQRIFQERCTSTVETE